MTKKKTPPPVKNPAPKKKGTPKATWKQTGQAHIPGLGTVKQFNVMMDLEHMAGTVAPPAGETRISELEAENYALKVLLSKHQSEPMPQTKNPLPQRATMLSQFAEQLDGQLSRFYNSLNTLDGIANRLLIQKEDGVKGNVPEAHDLSSRYSNIVSYFSAQNDRLDFLNTKLSDLI